MFKVFNEMYYIDFDEVESYVNIISTGETQINLVKYEMIKHMVDTILTEAAEIDENLGMKSTNELSLPFKIAFNSLLFKHIIKKI